MYTLIDLVIATFFDINKIIIEIGVTIIKKGIHSDNNMISFQIMIMILSRVPSSSPITSFLRNLQISILDFTGLVDIESILENLETFSAGSVKLFNLFLNFIHKDRHDLQRELNESYVSLFEKCISYFLRILN